MELSFTKFLETLLLPPGGLILMGLSGLLLWRYWRRAGLVLIATSLFLTYVLCTPLVAGLFMSLLETYPALKPDELKDNIESATISSSNNVDAIVILAGGRILDATEYSGDTVNVYSLERLRYGAFLHRKTKLPIVVSGGIVKEDMPGMNHPAEAELIKDVLENEFDVSVSYTETKSHTTYENAKFTADLLKENQIQSIYLVTTAAHMPRSVEAFEHFGVKVIAAPTAFYTSSNRGHELGDLLPGGKAQYMSAFALHEIVGRWWYRLRYY